MKIIGNYLIVFGKKDIWAFFREHKLIRKQIYTNPKYKQTNPYFESFHVLSLTSYNASALCLIDLYYALLLVFELGLNN